MPRITKDCFGTVIASLRKMKECIRCELLQECRAINWQESDAGAASVVRRPPGQEGESADGPGKRPGGGAG